MCVSQVELLEYAEAFLLILLLGDDEFLEGMLVRAEVLQALPRRLGWV